MKGGVAVSCASPRRSTEPSRDVTYVFYEGEEIDAELNGLAPGRPQPPRAARRRLRGAARAHQRRGRGRLPGHPAGRGRPPSGVAAHSARPWNGRQRHPRRRRRCCARLAAYEAADGRPSTGWTTARGSGGRHQRRHRRQRHPRPVRGRRSTTATRRTRPPRRPRRTCARSSTASTWSSPTPRPAPGPGLHLPGGPGLRRRRSACRSPGQVGLDRRRPVLRARHPGGELRPRRPQPRPHATTSACRSRQSSTPRRRCCGGWPDRRRSAVA